MSKEIITYEERTKWFHEARFGIFIHWGLYSVAGCGEWSMYVDRIPIEEYELLADRFSPDKFNADVWAGLAKEAGAKYMVLTTRHHDGFCLFDSKVSDFTSAKTAAKRDFVAEYVDACRRAGLKVGLYYSWLDWRFPGYFDRMKYPDSFKALTQQAYLHIRELMTNYGKIDILWYDGHWIPDSAEPWPDPASPFNSPYIPVNEWAELWGAKEVNAMVRQLQPNILINDRSGLNEDFDTPEQDVKSSQPGRAWESCMTIGDFNGWGYLNNNPNLKSTTQLIQYLVTAASGGGNYLLNIGPKPDGIIQSEFVSRLQEIGQWLKVNGESIYGSERCPFSGGMLGLTTAKGSTAYAHVFRWQGEEACIPGVAPEVESAYILTTGQQLQISYRSNGRLILKGLPDSPPDPHDTVIALKFHDRPKKC
jgi:Alpha-L-fucosidase